MKHEEFNWKQDKTTFFGQYWQVPNAKAIVILVHGMGEHSGRYADFVVPELNAAGYHVLSFDHFGHGKTPGKRGHCPNYEAVLNSVESAIAKAQGFFGNELPYFLYGHSMGGNVVANFILRRKHPFKGVILSSPMLRIAFEPPAWKMIAGNLLRNFYPGFQESTGLDGSAISRDQDAVAKYTNDPLVHSKVTINFSLPFFEAGEYAIDHANLIKTPTLLLHGDADAITSHEASEEFAKNGGKVVTFKSYAGAYHELHNEPEKKDVLDTITSWINKQII